jgi:hypothetical protein
MAVGFLFPAVDDLTQIHERLDKVVNGCLGLTRRPNRPTCSTLASLCAMESLE